MEYFEYIRHENGRVPLLTKENRLRRRVTSLKERMAIAPNEEIYAELQEAQAALQEAQEELKAYDAPPAQGVVVKDRYGGFHPHVPGPPKWMDARRGRK